MGTSMKVLCVCPIGVGNYLLMYPACKALKERDPGIQLHLLGLRNYIRDLAQDDPLWERIFIFDPTKMSLASMQSISIVTALRKEKYDAGLNFFASNKWPYNLLPFLCGIKQRFGFNYAVKPFVSLAWLCNRRLAVDPKLHDIKQNLRLADLFQQKKGDGGAITFPAMFKSEDEIWAQGYFAAHGDPKIRIGIHPGSSVEHGMDAKQWETVRFSELADKLITKLGGQVFVFGGPEEKHLKTTLALAMQKKPVIVESVNLRKTAALLKQCTLFICNDSGLMHMAACMHVPTIALFGPTDEKRNGPWGKHTLVVRKPMPGFPVWTAANAGDRALPAGLDPQASLKALTVTDAWEKIEPWVERLQIQKAQ